MSSGTWGLYSLAFNANLPFTGTTTPFVFQWWSSSTSNWRYGPLSNRIGSLARRKYWIHPCWLDRLYLSVNITYDLEDLFFVFSLVV